MKAANTPTDYLWHILIQLENGRKQKTPTEVGLYQFHYITQYLADLAHHVNHLVKETGYKPVSQGRLQRSKRSLFFDQLFSNKIFTAQKTL